MLQPEYKVADPICTFLFSVFVLCTTLTILRDVFRILMEGNQARIRVTPGIISRICLIMMETKAAYGFKKFES